MHHSKWIGVGLITSGLIFLAAFFSDKVDSTIPHSRGTTRALSHLDGNSFYRANQKISLEARAGYQAIKGKEDRSPDCNYDQGTGALHIYPALLEGDELVRTFLPEARVPYLELAAPDKIRLWNAFSLRTGLIGDPESPCQLPFGLTPKQKSEVAPNVLGGVPIRRTFVQFHMNCLACHLGEVEQWDSQSKKLIYKPWLGVPNAKLDLRAVAEVIKGHPLSLTSQSIQSHGLAWLLDYLSDQKPYQLGKGLSIATWTAYLLSGVRSQSPHWDISITGLAKSAKADFNSFSKPKHGSMSFMDAVSSDNAIPWSIHRHTRFHFTNNIFIKDPRWNYIINSSLYLSPGNSMDQMIGDPNSHPNVKGFKAGMDAIVKLIDETLPPRHPDILKFLNEEKSSQQILEFNEFKIRAQKGQVLFNQKCARCHDYPDEIKNVGTDPKLSNLNYLTARLINDSPLFKDITEKHGKSSPINPEYLDHSQHMKSSNPFSGFYRADPLISSFQRKRIWHDGSLSWEQFWNPSNRMAFKILGRHLFMLRFDKLEKLYVQDYLKVRCLKGEKTIVHSDKTVQAYRELQFDICIED